MDMDSDKIFQLILWCPIGLIVALFARAAALMNLYPTTGALLNAGALLKEVV